MRTHSLALFTLLLSLTPIVGCSVSAPSSAPGATGASGSSGTPGTAAPGAEAGSAPGLAGIWQDTAASSGDFVNPVTNESFSMTQGYSAKLTITAEGRYTFVHFSSGVAKDCSSVSYTDRSEGTARFSGAELVLHPSRRTLDVQACSGSGTRDLPADPITFSATLSPYERLGGEQTSKLALDGIYPLSLKLLNPSHATPTAREGVPDTFKLGDSAPFQEVLGLWAPSPGSSVDFYDPATGAFTIPGYDGSDHRWLRFTADGYEMATVSENVGLAEGVCKRDLVYYERGTARFNLLENVNGTSGGDVEFTPTDARVIEQIRNCEADDGVTRRSVTPGRAYFKWEYVSSYDGIGLGCVYPKNDWQFMACTNQGVAWNSFKRRS